MFCRILDLMEQKSSNFHVERTTMYGCQHNQWYALNNPLKRTISWEQLKKKLPCNNKWIICGDRNMVERKKDKARCKDIIFDRKKLAQNYFEKLAMEVKELVRFVKNLQFSWDNLRSGNERTMGKLYIVYVSKCIKDV